MLQFRPRKKTKSIYLIVFNHKSHFFNYVILFCSKEERQSYIPINGVK